MTAGTSSAARQHGPLQRDWVAVSFAQFADLYYVLNGYVSAGAPAAWTAMARWFECIASGDRAAASAIRDDAWRRLRRPTQSDIMVHALQLRLDRVIAARAQRVPAKTRDALDPSRCAFCGQRATTSAKRLWPSGDEFIETDVPYCGKC